MQQEGKDESQSARGDGTGHMDLVDMLDWLNKKDENEVV